MFECNVKGIAMNENLRAPEQKNAGLTVTFPRNDSCNQVDQLYANAATAKQNATQLQQDIPAFLDHKTNLFGLGCRRMFF